MPTVRSEQPFECTREGEQMFVVHRHSARSQHAVIVWERGTYRNLTRRDGQEVPLERALRDGHLVVELCGRKLPGGFALTGIGADSHGRARWPLVKKRDAEAQAAREPVSRWPGSVLSGHTIEQVAAEAGWATTRR